MRVPPALEHRSHPRNADPALLCPAPERWLASREVSEAVNEVENDGPALLDPPAPRRQLTLL